MKAAAAIVTMSVLAGCAWQVDLMPRDSGKIYQGQFTAGLGKSGDISVNIEGTVYSGKIVETSSTSSFGFTQAYGSNNRGAKANAFASSFTAGDSYLKAILSSPEGRGLRCDIMGTSGGGSGICLDDQSKVYDMVYSQK